MRAIDRLLQSWRYAHVGPYLSDRARVLDVGCADGVLFRRYPFLRGGVGIDPTLAADGEVNGNRLVRGVFPDAMPDGQPFDVIAMTAVLEHIPLSCLEKVAAGCARWLLPGGHLVATVPDPKVDAILYGMRALRLIDGMSLEEHHGFDVRRTASLFTGAGLAPVVRRRFQLGLNNLFVFHKPRG